MPDNNQDELGELLKPLQVKRGYATKKKDVKQALNNYITKQLDKVKDELWHQICSLETVVVTIPVNYTPNDRTITIPDEDMRGYVYSSICIPQEWIEKIFLVSVSELLEKRELQAQLKKDTK